MLKILSSMSLVFGVLLAGELALSNDALAQGLPERGIARTAHKYKGHRRNLNVRAAGGPDAAVLSSASGVTLVVRAVWVRSVQRHCPVGSDLTVPSRMRRTLTN